MICRDTSSVAFRKKERLHRLTYRCTHTSNKDDGAASLRDHVPSSFPRSKEGSMNVDVIQALYSVEWVTMMQSSAPRSAPTRLTPLTQMQNSSPQFLRITSYYFAFLISAAEDGGIYLQMQPPNPIARTCP